MSYITCGIDFGTSNSSIATANDSQINLIPVEQGNVTIPSAMFFERKNNTAHYGREAMEQFLSKKPGRLMRSLKRVLGTSVMRQGTMVNGEHMKFDQIIASFLKNLKDQAEITSNQPIEHVVMGRPVHFIDNDPTGNARAQDELKSIAEQLGFKHVEFQFEPIAAAFAHEVNVQDEKLAMVIDLGGGTSDFTVIRLSNQYINKQDRTSDILANTGVRIGGNDFDKELSLAAIMPELGYRTTYGSKNLEVPLRHYFDLSEWSKVNLLYTTKIIFQAKQLLYEVHDKVKYGRLIKILEQESGHSLLAATESLKIGLTSTQAHIVPFDFLEEGMSIEVQRTLFDASIAQKAAQIITSAQGCLSEAGVTTDDIELVILTGGSTEIPLIQSLFKNMFPNALIADNNRMASVGLGLAYDSAKKFN